LFPTQSTLSAAFPNPFNSSTKVEISLARDSWVSVAVFDLSGRRVETLTDGVKTAGKYTLTLDAGRLSSGVYICRVQTDREILSSKLVVLR
jgi:hypothetical protein